MDSLNKKRNRFYIISLIVLGFIVGILGIVHLRSTLTRTSATQTNLELQKIISNLDKEQSNLKKQITDLDQKIASDQEQIKNAPIQSINELKKDKAEVGLTPQEGKGAVFTLNDSSSSGSGNVEAFLIHASDLRDLVNLLWQSGAKAIAINNERIVFTTSIDCLVNTIMVNNTKLGPPYKVLVIGDQEKIQSAIDNKNNLIDFISRVKKNNLIFESEYKDKIEIPSYTSGFTFNYLN
jgi:uncharacterized protein YlxW (UPF0749 family)